VHDIKELGTGYLHPFTNDRGGFGGRNFPVGFKTAEVIDTHAINKFENRLKAMLPPFVTILLHDIPAIERIAPTLPGLAEVVWGDPCHNGRIAVFL
jgi:hypothetical protein